MSENISMTTNQPYLLKAFYDWIVDNELTPYVVVNASSEGVEVPQQFVKDGQIVLNASPNACVHFHMDYDSLSFQARFGGQPFRIFIPSQAVVAIYARENGAGTVFTVEDELTHNSHSATPKAEDKPPARAKPTLKIIK